MCTRHLSNRLRDDLLWCRQCHLLCYLWNAHEICRTLLHHCFRHGSAYGNFQLLAILATESRKSNDILPREWPLGSVGCCLANADKWWVGMVIGLVNWHFDELSTIFTGLYGALFRRNKEAAFSNYRLWESLGFVIAYAYSTALCARMKLYIVMAVLGLGTFCYIIVEIRQLRKVSISSENCWKILTFSHNFQERRQKALERRAADAYAEQNQTDKKIEDETDDERDELEEDIVVTKL